MCGCPRCPAWGDARNRDPECGEVWYPQLRVQELVRFDDIDENAKRNRERCALVPLRITFRVDTLALS